MKAKVVAAEVSEDGQRGVVTVVLGPDNGGHRINLGGPADVVERMGAAGFIGSDVELEFVLRKHSATAVFS